MWKFFALNIQCFAGKSIFGIFYNLLVTYLVAHRFTLGNPLIAIQINININININKINNINNNINIYLLRVI